MRKRTSVFAIVAMLAATLASGSATAQTSDSLERRSGPGRVSGFVSDFDVRSPDDLVQVFIQLDEPSVSAFVADNDAGAAAQRVQGAKVVDQQNRLRAELESVIVDELSSMVVGANGLRVEVRAGDVPTIRSTAGVKSVAPVTRYHLTNKTSVPSIGGTQVANAGFDGEGITVAVIDTGIDYTHASFDGSGDPEDYASNDPGLIEAGSFPTAKVVNGFDFAGPVYDPESDDPVINTPRPDPDPLDVDGHGSHVAATVAGLDPNGPVEEGMAPEASLLALKVFADETASTDLVADAIEFALDPNNDLSMDDAVDVINMSLGSDFGDPADPSAIASQNASDAGVVVVASSGNAGSVSYVTGSPAVADGVISVAASTDDGVELLGVTVNSPAEIADDYEGAAGDFGSLSTPTTANLGVEQANFDACTPFTEDMDGLIALVQRGTCEFTTKVRNAENAGAVGVLMFNNEPGAPIGMAHNGSEPKPDIPAVMVSLADGEAIQDVALSEAVNVTLSDAITIPRPDLADTMAGFTSRGPGFGNGFKPDLSAPGFSIESAAVGTGTAGALLSGTSMAAPHVAGAAAQLLDAYPNASPAQVKAMLMNSARPAVGEDGVDLASQGTGIVQIDRAALDLEGYASPGGISFGRFNPTTATTETETITVTRLDDGDDAVYDVELIPNQELPGVTWELSSDTLETSGGTGTVDVTVSVDPGAMVPDDGFFSQAESDGWVRLTNQDESADTMVVGLLAVPDPASIVTAQGGEDQAALANAGPSDGFADGFTLAGEGDDSTGTVAAVGYRTNDYDGTPVVEFGVALNEAWTHPSALEVDVFIDVDGDGEDDFLVAAWDLGLLGGGDPTGDWVTIWVDLNTGDVVPEWFTTTDFNDRVSVLPVDQLGAAGILDEGDSDFTFDVVVWVGDVVTGVIEDLEADLAAQVTSDDGLSLLLAAGESADIVTEGSGDMLWLFSNNPLESQHSVTTVTTAEEPPTPGGPSFDDVPDDHLFAKEIAWLAETAITRGCNPPANTLFCPEDGVTRGQMAAFLNRALDLDSTTEDFFADDDENVFESDINELAAAGITKGCNPPANDQFCPERTLNRAEMATFMMRGYLLTDGAGTDLFVDDDDNIHESAIDVIGTAGITRGCNPPANDRFCPDRTISRGEMAAFLFRAFDVTGLGGG